ncbi:MAG: Fe-S cluster assembly protein SufB, partial [Thermoanaerobaculia bacterium]
MAPSDTELLEQHVDQKYEAGFITDVEAETFAPGLDEDVVRRISTLKGEPGWMLEWRLKAFRHWQTLEEPTWANIKYEPVDYQAISYYSAPKSKKDGPKSLDEVDPEILRTYEKLGIPLQEQQILAGIAVDAVF